MELEASICPLPWSQIQENLDAALEIIKKLAIPEEAKEQLYELLTVDDITGWPEPKIETWHDSEKYAYLLVPPGASWPQRDFLVESIQKLERGEIL